MMVDCMAGASEEVVELGYVGTGRTVGAGCGVAHERDVADSKPCFEG